MPQADPAPTAPAGDRAARFGLRRPAAWRRWLELRVVVEVVGLVVALPWLLAQPRGRSRRVVVVPGFLFGDATTWPLRTYLRALGHDAIPWRLGRNTGRPEEDAERLGRRVARLRGGGAPLALVGWSLGGVIARRVAQLRPDDVDTVITLGTPIEGGPVYTTAAAYYERRGVDLVALARRVHEINDEGVPAALTVMFTRGDGIVDWRAAIDRYNRHARQVRVCGSHVGLGYNPLVWRVVARTLAGPAPPPAAQRTSSSALPKSRSPSAVRSTTL